LGKKQQKTLLVWASAEETPPAQINKNFLVLFSKKEPLACYVHPA